MSMPIRDLDDFKSSGFFKPAKHMSDLAILVEPKSIERNVPNTYRGQTRERDEVTCDLSIFGTQDSIDKGKPTEVLKAVKVTHPGLANTFGRAIGSVVVVRIVKQQFDNGEGYGLSKVAPAIQAKVAEYYDARETAVQTARASAPGFGD